MVVGMGVAHIKREAVLWRRNDLSGGCQLVSSLIGRHANIGWK